MNETLRGVCDPLLLDSDKLAYDLSNCAYIEAHLMTEEGHACHLVMDLCQEGNVDRIADMVSIAQDEVRKILRGSSPDEAQKKLIHEYVLAIALNDWLSISNQAAADKWRDRANAALLALSASEPFVRKIPPM